jgi:prophage regulatory protein
MHIGEISMSINNQPISLIRRKQLEQRMGIGRSTIYLRISQSLITSPVSLGANSVGWPLHEIDAIIVARVAGKSDDEIRLLVSELEAARKLVA